MLQYLLNATAIWLVSLIAFDLFLRRETYHAYNRFYLLFTFLLGVLLPLLQWQQSLHIKYPDMIGKPVQQVVAAKLNVITTATTSTNNWQLWLTIIYSLGVLVALCLLVIEMVKLATTYRTHKRSSQNSWTIIETSKEHAPYSFLNVLFVSNRHQYTDEEWNMILGHEKRHTSLFHIADLVLMQLARVVLWFHPLVYLYNKRLLMVHEYQADHSATQEPQMYGRFLIEQAILPSAPSLSHSFNRSPIKKRILMLTRRSSTVARTKMLVFIPVALVCMLCFSKNIFSQKKGSNGPVAYIGNTGAHSFVTYEQVFADPSINTSDPEYKITRYTLSLWAKGKDYWGPFSLEYSSKIPDKFIQRLKDWQSEKIDTVRVFIEEIHANYKGKDMVMNPSVFKIVR